MLFQRVFSWIFVVLVLSNTVCAHTQQQQLAESNVQAEEVENEEEREGKRSSLLKRKVAVWINCNGAGEISTIETLKTKQRPNINDTLVGARCV